MLVEAAAYDEMEVITFYNNPDSTQVSCLQVRPGMCSIFFPEDGHLSGIYSKVQSHFVKIIIKLLA